MKTQSIDIQSLDKKHPEIFSAIDRQFADFLAKLTGEADPDFILTARLVSNWTGRGNVCLHVPSVAGKDLMNILGEQGSDGEIILPGKDEWLGILKKSSCVGKPGEYKPLILDDRDRLYLQKYWFYEQKLAENIGRKLGDVIGGIDKRKLNDSIARLFPDRENDSEQVIASVAALLRKFCVISGGPGTGKTTTILKILVMLLEQNEKPLRIVLTAPTGKAAAKINQSVQKAIDSLDCPDEIKECLPSESFTIHRLLNLVKVRSFLQEEKYDPLPYDIIVVDESSMADLGLMYRLFGAVHDDSRIILLGDKDQLSSVEAGAVFGDICNTGSEHVYSDEFRVMLDDFIDVSLSKKKAGGQEKPKVFIGDSIAVLKKSYRFDRNSGIKRLSEEINNGNTDAVIRILRDNEYTDLAFLETGADGAERFFADRIVSGYKDYITEKKAEEKFLKLPGFAVLCALRNGRYGVERLNALAEDVLRKRGLISAKNEWYENRPVMITQNDYGLKLFNGDIGIILKDETEDSMRFFTESGGVLRKHLPQRLQGHETVFAMTVHKSQGSEFDTVLLALPDFTSPVLCRELLYTAVTRARKRIEIFGSEKIIRYMVKTPTQRTSGLRDALWGTQK